MCLNIFCFESKSVLLAVSTYQLKFGQYGDRRYCGNVVVDEFRVDGCCVYCTQVEDNLVDNGGSRTDGVEDRFTRTVHHHCLVAFFF